MKKVIPADTLVYNFQFERNWSLPSSEAGESLAGHDNQSPNRHYSPEMQSQLKKACNGLPSTFTKTKQLLRRAVRIGEWTHIYPESEEVVKRLCQKDLPRMFQARNTFDCQRENHDEDEGDVHGDTGYYYQVGDASKLCLVLAMLLAAAQFSSSNLISYCYNDHPLYVEKSNESENLLLKHSIRKQVIKTLEEQFRVLLRISILIDTSSTLPVESKDYEYFGDTALRGALMHIYFLKNAERFNQDENTLTFMSELAKLVEQCKLHQIDASTVSSSSPPISSPREKFKEKKESLKLERRRRLFYHFYVLER